MTNTHVYCLFDCINIRWQETRHTFSINLDKHQSKKHTHTHLLLHKCICTRYYIIHSSKVFIKLNNILSVFNIHSTHTILQSKYETEDHKPSHIKYIIILSRRDIFKVLNFHQIWDDLHIYTLMHVYRQHNTISTQVIIIVYHINIIYMYIIISNEWSIFIKTH